MQRLCTEMMRGKNGTIIVMDPRSGRVCAVANAPVAFEQAFPAGSTIKMFTALAALETGVTDPGRVIRCRGQYERDGFVTVCSHPREDPNMDMTRALAYSCNFYFATLGERLDPATFKRYLEDFGFGKATGVGAAYEAAGRLALEKEKVAGRVAIGESAELLVTPIQLITAFCALSNGGRLFRPYGGSASTPWLRRELPFARSCAVLYEGLEAGATIGTSRKASIKGIRLMGKTGTPTAVARKDKTHAWFVGAAPAEAPEIAVLVFMGRGCGGVDAAPIAGKVLSAYFAAEAH